MSNTSRPAPVVGARSLLDYPAEEIARRLPSGRSFGHNRVSFSLTGRNKQNASIVLHPDLANGYYVTAWNGADFKEIRARIDGTFGLDQNSAQPRRRQQHAHRPRRPIERKGSVNSAWANRLYQQAGPVVGTVGEAYYRSRGLQLLPSTARFSPASASQTFPAVLIPFAMPVELGPDEIGQPEEIEAVHCTFIRHDGSGKAPLDSPKMTIGSPQGLPLAISPIRDMGALVIAEGIEDAATLAQGLAIGAWAAGAASFMPSLVPSVVRAKPQSVSIVVDADPAGERFSRKLYEELLAAGIAEVTLVHAGVR